MRSHLTHHARTSTQGRVLRALFACFLSAVAIPSVIAAVAPDKFGTWPRQLGSGGYLYTFARHPSGDIYGAGSFRDDFNFGNIGQVQRLQGSGDEGWVGAFSWDGVPKRKFTFRSNAAGEVGATGVAVDEATGDVYVVGYWHDHLQVEDGISPTFQRNALGGNAAMFLAKFVNGQTLGWVTIIGNNAGAGPPIWATGGVKGTRGMSIDASGNIYIVGYCRNGAVFESAAGSGGSNLTPNNVAGQNAGFLAKYQPNGAVEWVRLLDSPNNSDVTTAVATDSDGSVYVAGYSDSTQMTLESDTTITADTLSFNNARLFIAKYNSMGRRQLQWKFGGADGGSSLQQRVANMVVDENKIVIGGWHRGNLLKPDGSNWAGPGNEGARAGYAAAFGKTGTPLWARALAVESSSNNEVHDVDIDETGDVLVAGYCPNAEGTSQSYGGVDGFLGRLNGTTGATVWIQSLGLGANDTGFGVLAGPGRQIITSGAYANGVMWKGSLLYDISPDGIHFGIPMGFVEGALNDDFANREVLSGNSILLESSNLIATKESGEPNHAGNAGGKSLWWEWVAPAHGTLVVDTLGSLGSANTTSGANTPMNTTLGVYTGAVVNALAEIASNDDASITGATSRVSVGVTAGMSYKIAVDGFNGGAGIIGLSLAFTPTPTAVPVITSAGTAAATAGQSFSYQIAADNSPSSYNATGLPSGLVVNTTSGLISGTPTANGTFNVTLSAANIVGTGTKTLTLTVNASSAGPANDHFVNAQQISGASGQITGTNVDATKEAGEPNHWGSGGRSIWFRWTAPSSGSVVFDTEGSSFDTMLAAYSGSAVDALTQLAQDDDSGSGTLSRIELTVQQGTTYYIAVDGYGGVPGSVTLNWLMGTTAPVISSVGTATGTVGQSFSYQIVASGSPTSYGATGLPAGLTVNTTSGLISGTPTASGTFNVTLSAVNIVGTGTKTLTLTVNASSAGPGWIDESFINPNANASVMTLALQPDGKVLIGGAFSTVGGTARNRIARLNADGSLDLTFTPPDVNGIVYCVAVQSDGKVLIGGGFTSVGGTVRNRIARLNADGSLDLTFNPDVGLEFGFVGNGVFSIALLPNGKMLIGGDFNSVGGVVRPDIARLNADGSLDLSFNPDSNGGVNSLAVQPDGKIILGGIFSTIGGIVRNRIARLNADGSLDLTYNPNVSGGVFGSVLSLVIQPDGRVLIGGEFSAVGGTARRRIARVNADGSLDLTFDCNFRADSDGDHVSALAVQPDGKVLVGGNFVLAGTTTFIPFARFNADGSLDGNFNPDVRGDIGGASVLALALQPDGKVLLGGRFITIGGISRNNIARINASVSQDTFPPVVTSAGTASGTVGQLFGYQIIADNNPESFSATELPPGLSISSTLGTLVGTPTVSGIFNVTLSASNPAGTGTKTLVITINPAAPAISSAGTATGMMGQSFSYQIVASGSPTSYGATGLPSGVTVNTTSGLISGTPTASGTFSVTLSAVNAGGTGTKTLMLTINPPATSRVVRVVNASGPTGGTVVVPVELVSQGDENALGFSLTFDQTKLSNPQVALGADASGASLNVNASQTANGRLGVALAKSAGTAFATGTRRVVDVTFTLATVVNATDVTVGFGDQPVFREISDAVAGVLSATYQAGAVSITVGYEGDVAPRPNGNDSVGISDWVQVGRFVAGLDTAANGSEFQRADVAPKDTKGDGRLTISDWVQAGRYAAALDPITAAGGPSSPVVARVAASTGASAGNRKLWLDEARGLAGATVEVMVCLTAQGDENAFGFSVSFDPAQLTFVEALQGPDTTGAQWIVNQNSTSSGRVGVAAALSAGQSFTAGTRQVARLRFQTAASGNQSAPLNFGDSPVSRETSDSAANILSTSYVPGFVRFSTSSINPPSEQIRNLVASEGYRLAIETVAGKSYRVEWSADFQTWNQLTTFTSSGTAFEFLDEAAKNAPRRFYRVVEQ